MPTYPLTMPTAPGFVRSVFRLRRATAASTSPFTGRQQVYQHPGAWWEAELSLPPMLRAQAAEWQAFLMECQGQFGTFYLSDPDAKVARGNPGGSPVCSVNGQTGNAFDTSGWPANRLILRKGDYLQIGAGAAARLHMVTQDAATGASGTGVLVIEPALRSATIVNTPVLYAPAVGVFRLASSDVEWSADHISRYGITFAAREAL